MNEIKRVFPVLFVHILLGFLACIVFMYIKPLPVELIAPFVSGYRFRAAVLLFITYIPALLISGLLLGYALAFSKNASDSIDRWSEQLLSYLKGAFLICIISISIYIILSEGTTPIMQAKQEQAVIRTKDYADLMSVAQDSAERGLPNEAEFQVSMALQIWPKSEEASKLLNAVQLDLSEISGGSLSPEKNTSAEEPSQALSHPSGLTVLQALDKALEAEKAGDFYNEHYFAMLAYSMAPGTDPNKIEALRLAKTAWNQITEGTDQLKAEGDKELYRNKQEGYEAIQNNDFLKAYYIFLSLQEEQARSVNRLADPDVERFLEVSRLGVLDSFFFIDETLHMKLFETARDVFFVIKGSDGFTNSVFIRGLTYTRSSGRDMAYLRDFEYARFDRDNKLRYQISVPYVKMFPYTAQDGRTEPELLLKSVNRKIKGADIIPVVIAGEVPEMQKNILQLDLPYADFNLIVTANKGPAAMSLIDLFLFTDKAEKYGFSRTVYLSELIGRLSDPFLMLIVSIYVLILGWRYRLGKNVLFKAWWLLTIPLFPMFSLFLIETVTYFSHQFIAVFVNLVPQNPLVLMLGILSLCFVVISIYFFSQRSD